MSRRAWLLLGVAVVLLAAYLAADTSIHRSVALLAGASLAYVLLIAQQLSRGWVLLAFVVVAAVGASQEPAGTDLWIYQAYGRIVVEHGDNPYVAVPSDYPDDPVMGRVSGLYQDTPSAYGPAFVAVAAVVAAATGESELAGRVAWQLLCAVAVAGSILLLWRRGVSGRALAAFALSPVVAYQLVHLAHNDAIIGLAVLVGCLLAESHRTTWAAVALAVAALMKAPVGLALVVLLVWLLANRRVVEAVRAGLAAAGVAVLLLIPAGGWRAIEPMLDSSGSVNATSIWNAVRGDWVTFVWRPIRGVEGPAGTLVSILAIAIPAVIGVWAAWRFRSRPLYAPITIALVAWLVFALYPSAWYYAWTLPLLGLWAARQRILIGAQASLYQLTTQAWLMPVAALISGDGRLGLVDRLPAPLLGLISLTGVALVVWLLLVPEVVPSEAPSVTGPPAG